MKLALATALAVTAATAETDAEQSGCELLTNGKHSPIDVDRYYGERAASVIRAGLADDRAALEKLVSREAIFFVWDGDSGWVPRGATGVPAAMLFSKKLAPARYDIRSRLTGPISVSSRHCEWSVTVLLSGTKLRDGAEITFKFKDDRMIEGTGSFQAVTSGTLP
jgi:hypothetical protein